MNEVTSESLDRILRSSLFRKAERQSRFLRHVVERHLAGDDNSLRETSIGVEVYHRLASYDPATDPIVRVEAARLRSRLREYYETEGARDEIRIDIPKGSYVPTFEPRAPAPEPALSPIARPRRSRAWLVPACLGVLVLLAIALTFWLRSPRRVRPIESIAVLPFTDLSERSELSYVAAGLTEQIQDELTRIRDPRVIGSTSAARASANPDLRAAARQMAVDALVEGSIRTENKKVRVAVRLIEAASGSHLWSASFEGEVAGLFARRPNRPGGGRQTLHTTRCTA